VRRQISSLKSRCQISSYRQELYRKISTIRYNIHIAFRLYLSHFLIRVLTEITKWLEGAIETLTARRLGLTRRSDSKSARLSFLRVNFDDPWWQNRELLSCLGFGTFCGFVLCFVWPYVVQWTRVMFRWCHFGGPSPGRTTTVSKIQFSTSPK